MTARFTNTNCQLTLSPTHPSAFHCPQGTALLSGHYSTKLAEGAHERLRRSGFAGITSQPSPMGPLDLEDFDSLVFR